MFKRYCKLEVYIPESHVETVKNALFKAGAGAIGNYRECCWCSNGIGQFTALDSAKPFIGKVGCCEFTPEVKLETICRRRDIKNIIKALIKAHPYETPAFQYFSIKIK